MKLYGEQDAVQCQLRARQARNKTLLCALPAAALAVLGFALRMEPLCAASCILCGGVIILMYDLRIAPQRRYGKHLKEIHTGLTRETAGTLVRIGSDLVFEDGVYFHEMILNIYEDMAEEGERRFLLDSVKTIPEAWVGQDVAVVSHGSFVLEIRRMGAADGQDERD